MKVKMIISALLCLFLVSCNSSPAATAPTPPETEGIETSAPVTADAPKITVSYDDLNNYTFVIKTPDDTFRVAGDNMKGKRSQLYVSMSGYDVILELNTKGGCKMFSRTSGGEDYIEAEIEYTGVDLSALRSILYQVGVDFEGYYKDAKFTLKSEADSSYIYKMDYNGKSYDLTVDKETGIWTRLSCDGKLLMELTDFSLEKGIIPNH